MIEVSNLSKRFGETIAVDDLTFTVESQQTLVLLGTSGCGKTTTLKMVNRLVEPSDGEISVNGNSIFNQDPINLRRSIGYVIQNSGLFPHYTVAENISIVPDLLGWDKNKTRDRTEMLMELLGLDKEQFLDRYPAELSGGQQQRVSLARALAADPPIILMDEPFGALDPITRQQIREEFHRLESLIAKTIILVTHDIAEAIELGDMICLMKDGRKVEIGSPEDLVFFPNERFTRDFFSTNRFHHELQVVSVRRVLKFVENIDRETSSEITFHVDDDLLKILDSKLQEYESETAVYIKDDDNNILARTNQNNLLEAFINFKKDLVNGGA